MISPKAPDLIKSAGIIEEKRPIPMTAGRTLTTGALVYVVKGNGQYESTPGRPQPVTAGTLMILHPGRWHRFDPIGRWTEHYLIYHPDRVAEHWGLSFPTTVSLVSMGEVGEFRDAFEGLVASHHTAGHGRRLLVQFHLAQLLHLALFRIKGISPHPRYERFGYIERHFLEHNTLGDMDLQEVALRHGLGYHQFRYRFKKQTGLSPKKYYLKAQVEKAKKLLRLREQGVAEVARACGFHSAAHFSTTFRQAVGVTPSDWRGKVSGKRR